MDTIGNIFTTLGEGYPMGVYIRNIIFLILGIFSFHRPFYFFVGLFWTRKFGPAKHQYKYAVLIPARNEEPVISNLLESISKQDYPKELITTFVIADNCTDDTAKIARKCGAICYERFDDARRTKGFALQFLFENIKKDYGIDSFDGYFIFDSDNLLKSDYITRMNESFDAGEKIITSYRNTKNFDESWVASTYAIHWLRSIRFRHRARSVLRLATNIQGTGFLFANELVKDGWDYTSLTEDRAFTADAVAQGYMISYNDSAMFYDEQPVSVRIAFRQRTRWSKGHLQAFVETGGKLFKNIFVGPHINKNLNEKSEKKSFFMDAIDWVRYRFAAFDTLSQLIPSPIIRMFFWITVTMFLYSCSSFTEGFVNFSLFSKGGNITMLLTRIFGDIYINAKPGFDAVFTAIGMAILWRLCSVCYGDISNIAVGAYVLFIERKRIKKMPMYKQILYCLTWPVFDIFYRYSMYCALFMHVTWKQIPHTSTITINDLEVKGGEISDETGKNN